jgi:hypothetical protein
LRIGRGAVNLAFNAVFELKNSLMTINDLLTDSKNQFSLDIFSPKTIAAVDAALVQKNGKFYLQCGVRRKEVIAKPEEIIRQLWLNRLEHDFGYPPARLAVEFPITFGRDTSKRADIVVFDDDRPTVPYIIIEVKQPTERSRKDQLKSYCHATGAPLAVWSDGLREVVWHRKNPNYFVINRDNRVFRVDTQFFSKAAITTERILKHGQWETLGRASTRIESFGAYALTNAVSYVDEGVPFWRTVCV